MAKKNTSFKQVYEQDTGSGRYLIETALDKYSDVFNEWDPAPFKHRDLDPDLLSYITTCALDIPLKHPLVLQFALPADQENTGHEEKVRTGIMTFFELAAGQVAGQLAKARRRAAAYIITAFSFLLSAFGLQPVFEKQVFLTILLEGLFIGGWVFLWEALATLFFRNRETRIQLKGLKRLGSAPVRFRYAQNMIDKTGEYA